MELQEKYKIRYKGRKGRKRLQAIEDEIAQLRQEIGSRYNNYEEMELLENLLPDPEICLYFMRRLRDLNAMWSGTLTYGFLRLCGKWIRQKQIKELDQRSIDQMMESLLPYRQWEQLNQAPQPEEQA